MNNNNAIIIDRGYNTIIIKENILNKIKDEEIISKIGNENDDFELIQELDGLFKLNYIKQLENGLMNALNELSRLYKDNNKDFDYYDKLKELADMDKLRALDFLDKLKK